jgi:hypothetical protein
VAVGKSSLGRVVDPEALDACAGPRARLRVEVPAAWLAEGADLVVTSPARLSCARCDGGGCDACARSGALHAPDTAADRILRASIPPSDRALGLRIPRPFGADHAIVQLLLEVAPGISPSTCVVRIERPAVHADEAPRKFRALPPWPLVAAALAAAILFALLGR